MATYIVHIAFAAPGLQGRFEWHRSLLRRQSIRMHGSAGELAAIVVVNSSDGPARAGLHAAELVAGEWRAHRPGGPLRRVSWRAERERVLAGLLTRRRRDGGFAELLWRDDGRGPGGRDDRDGPDDNGDDGGTAGVREPRRPKPAPPSMGISLPLD